MKTVIILLIASATANAQMDSRFRGNDVLAAEAIPAGVHPLGSRFRGNDQGTGMTANLMAQAPARRLPHRFADRTNIILTATHATLRGLDVVTTRHLLSQGGRERILPRAVVNSTPAFIAFSAAEVAGTALLMYAAHRARHHRIERAWGGCRWGSWAPWSSITPW